MLITNIKSFPESEWTLSMSGEVKLRDCVILVFLSDYYGVTKQVLIVTGLIRFDFSFDTSH